MFALVDCNNFYASCERLFRPELRLRPIIVLSSGDGCVIARSNEAKALGIAMGEPFFNIHMFCQQHRVTVFSSNFTLYRDMSQRVMSVIESSWEEVEVYSIDEAFLDLSSMPPDLHLPFCDDLQKKIFRWTGIPVSIGLGRSKTLAKLSNHVAKKILKVPVFHVEANPVWFQKIDIGDVWGIGPQSRKKLIAQGMTTAADLISADLNKLRKQHNVVIARTAMELQGIPCLDIRDVDEAKKSILSSRSFHKTVSAWEVLAQAVSMHAASVYEKLREQRSVAYAISVFLKTNRFREDMQQYNPTASIRLVIPTDDVRLITHHAKACLKTIYKPGFDYKKVGVWLTELADGDSYQFDLFQERNEKTAAHTDAFLGVFDAVNQRFGQKTVRLAAQGFDRSWDTRMDRKSPAYTTRWAELPVVKNGT